MRFKLASKPFLLLSDKKKKKWIVSMNYAKRVSHPYEAPIQNWLQTAEIRQHGQET